MAVFISGYDTYQTIEVGAIRANASTGGSITKLTFTKPFKNPPKVCLTLKDSGTAWIKYVHFAVNNITTTGCEIMLAAQDNVGGTLSTVQLSYIAIDA